MIKSISQFFEKNASYLSVHKIIIVLVASFVTISIPTTLFLISQKQDIRQNAAGSTCGNGAFNMANPFSTESGEVCDFGSGNNSRTIYKGADPNACAEFHANYVCNQGCTILRSEAGVWGLDSSGSIKKLSPSEETLYNSSLVKCDLAYNSSTNSVPIPFTDPPQPDVSYLGDVCSCAAKSAKNFETGNPQSGQNCYMSSDNGGCFCIPTTLSGCTSTPPGGGPTPTSTIPPSGGNPNPTQVPIGGNPNPTQTPIGGNPNPTQTPVGNTISGKVYIDIDDSNTYTSGDVLLDDQVVKLSNGVQTRTNSQGEYNLSGVSQGSYTLTLVYSKQSNNAEFAKSVTVSSRVIHDFVLKVSFSVR